MKTAEKNSVVKKLFPKETVEFVDTALEAFESYKNAADIIERTNIALGRKTRFVLTTGTTINAKMDSYGITPVMQHNDRNLY